jgi:lysophospholipase L1-like esterase
MFIRICALGLSAIIALLFLEGALRIRQYLKYGSAKSALYETVFDPASQLTIPKPNHATRTIRIDSRGFRNPELGVPKPRGTVRLAFLGASTTFCSEASSNEATWPSLVRQMLQDQWPEVRFDYVNAAFPGYVVNHSIRNLEFRVKQLEPDVIVIYEGINDLSRDSRDLAKAQGIERGRVDAPGLLGRWSLTWFLIEKNLQILARQKDSAAAARQIRFDAHELPKGFQQRLRSLVDEAGKVAPVVAIATFSHKVRRSQSPEEQLRNANTHLYYMPYLSVDSILTGIDAYNQVIRTVAHSTGALLIEGEDTIPGDDRHFNDSIHFKDAGCLLMAQRIANILKTSQQLNKLVSARHLR